MQESAGTQGPSRSPHQASTINHTGGQEGLGVAVGRDHTARLAESCQQKLAAVTKAWPPGSHCSGGGWLWPALPRLWPHWEEEL